MGLDCVVLVKEVPDTKNIGADAMKEDGTVNRDALPAIFNPEDLNALELAMEVKERQGGKVSVLTMGRPSAGELLRQSLYRGADAVFLLTSPRFAGADTLATSYTLAMAVRKVGRYDLVFCGRQAIDGDTGQVGPQLAQKLGIPQATYVEAIVRLEAGRIEVRRDTGNGSEVLRLPLPALLTVTADANVPRPPSARLMMRYKLARSLPEIRVALVRQNPRIAPGELARLLEDEVGHLRSRGLVIPSWEPEDIGAEPGRIGWAGSPTKVKEIHSVVLKAREIRQVELSEVAIRGLIRELISEHIIG